jgi:hypothetical protein
MWESLKLFHISTDYLFPNPPIIGFHIFHIIFDNIFPPYTEQVTFQVKRNAEPLKDFLLACC